LGPGGARLADSGFADSWLVFTNREFQLLITAHALIVVRDVDVSSPIRQ
jgi:hypothetical protein